jgi:hypothetical protein
MQELQQHLRLATFVVLMQALLWGLVGAEVWQLGKAISIPIASFVAERRLELVALVLCGASIAVLLVYAFARDSLNKLKIVLRSGRLDLATMTGLGILISASFDGLGSEKYNFLAAQIKPPLLILLTGLPLVVVILLLVRASLVFLGQRRKDENSFFLGDEERQDQNQDLLEISETAARFAERVLNGNSSKSLVFGVDAPWGIGKSSFVNFCVGYWTRQYKHKVIVYRFEPLRFDAKTDLLQRFVDDLVLTIQRSVFIPELRTIVSRYRRLISGNGKVSVLGGTIDLQPGGWTVEDSIAELESALSRIEKKIVVVVDDLDRLEYAKVKEILFAVQKGFKFPNISYVLCYDTDNIVSLKSGDQDAGKVREFLEKFVNVKISLFLDSGVLAKFVSENFKQAMQNNLNLEHVTIEKISGAIDVLGKIYNSNDYHHYQEILGDVRKLKRLINTLMLFEIPTTDFENSDFDKEDLVHLLLVYINYPNIFRKIYNAEACGKTGFFSLTRTSSVSAGGGKYVNSDAYIKFVEALEPNPRFLLSRIFGADIKLKDDDGSIPGEHELQTFACFNGGPYGGRRNLERHLNLIVKLSKPGKLDSYKFYLNQLSAIKRGATIDEIFALSDFDATNGEASRNEVWRIIVNASYDLEVGTGQALLRHVLTHLPEYSLLSIPKLTLGARDDMVNRIVKLVDQFGWGNVTGQRLPNTPANICEIAEWIFGDGRHVNEGIIDTLAETKRGPLGWYDLLIFRLYCSADRAGNVHEIITALVKRADENAESTGILSAIAIVEMRQISQRIFKIFEAQYIQPNINFFTAVDNLTNQELAGLFHPYVERMVKERVISAEELEEAISVVKAQIKGFVIYQLGNKMVNSGVGCGFYDEAGEQNNGGIAKRMNDYLFEQCFASSLDTPNFECFLDFMLGNFGSMFGGIWRRGIEYGPHIDEYKKVLFEDQLVDFWAANRTQILLLNYSGKEKQVRAANYLATYKEDLPPVFSMLDKLLESKS